MCLLGCMRSLNLSRGSKSFFTKLKQVDIRDIGISYALFVFSLTIRFLFNTWVYANYDVTEYVSKEGFYWETYMDAKDYYQHYLYAFRYQNWDLYSIQPWPLSGYVYGPVFAYVLVFFSWIVQIFHPEYSRMELSWEAVTLAPKVIDSFTAVFVYLIIKHVIRDKGSKKSQYIFAIAGSIFFTIMPVVLFYNDVVYLNSYGFTFFAVVSLYFLIRGDNTLSAAFLAISLLTKLTVLFMIPLWVIYVFRNNWREGIKFFLDFLSIWIIFSLPWIFIHRFRYFHQQLWPGATFNTHFGIEPTWILWSTTPFHVFLYWHMDKLALFYYQLNNLYLPLFTFNILCYFSMFLIAPHLQKKQEMFLSYTAMFSIGMHIFLSRGNYKYYDPFFITFIVIALVCWSYQIKDKRIAFTVLFAIISWVFIVNVWIIIKIKWLHMFYVFLLFVTMFATFDKETLLGLYKQKNYAEAWKFTKEFFAEVYREIIKKNIKAFVTLYDFRNA